MTDRARPSTHGAILGRVLSNWAEQGAIADEPPPCSGCAFRSGAIANRLAPTVREAMDCTIGVDPAGFGCHKGMKDGTPTRACLGWLAARRYVAENFERATKDLGRAAADVALCNGKPNEVRADFEIFLDLVDPDRALDDYALADLWARR